MCINHVHLITFHVVDLLRLLGKDVVTAGTLALMSHGEQLHEADLDDLCLVIKIEAEDEATPIELPAKDILSDDESPSHLKFYPKS